MGFILTEVASGETPSTNQLNLYAKTDHKLYYKNSDGTETEVTAINDASYTTISKTTDYTFTASDCYGKYLFDNTGASQNLNFYLPAPAADYELTIKKSGDYSIILKSTSSNILLEDKICGKWDNKLYLTLRQPNAIVKLVAYDTTNWIVQYSHNVIPQQISWIEGGENLSAILDTTGKVWAWGINDVGQLGDNSTTCRSVPVPVCLDKTYLQISTGLNHTLAIDYQRKAWAWGENTKGQLGDNSTANRSTPIAVCLDKTWLQLAAGVRYSVGIEMFTGKAWAWGDDTYGYLGDNSISTCKCTPVAVCLDYTYRYINTYNSTFGIDNNTGKAYSWGLNSYGQLGINFTESGVSTPIAVCLDLTFTQISGGFTHNLGILKSTGKLWTWGSNTSGEIGDNTLISRLSPTAVCLDYTFFQVSGGQNHSLGIDAVTGKVWAWGYNVQGQLGDNSVVSKLTPVAVALNYTFRQISTGYLNSVGIDATTGKAWAWGHNAYGAVGDNSVTCKSVPTAVASNLTYSQISAGNSFCIGIEITTGKAVSWGRNEYGQLGQNQVSASRSVPVSVCLDYTFKQVAAGQYHTIGIDAVTGKAWAWGSGSAGELGDNQAAANRSTPVAVCLDLTWSQVTAAGQLSLGLDYQGKLWSWGLNTYGQLGNNSVTTRVTPVAVCLDYTFVQIDAGNAHVLAIDYQGKTWGWGYNPDGEVGNRFVYKATPCAVCLDFTYRTINCGDQFAVATIQTDRGYSWGRNEYGQLGDTTKVNKSTPIAITQGPASYQQINAGVNAAAGIVETGTLGYGRVAYCWGFNNYGQLGLNSTSNMSTPTAVCLNYTYVYINAKNNHVIACDIFGEPWGWGNNTQGQLGDNESAFISVPFPIITNITWSQISLGQNHTVGIDTLTGKAFAWGLGTSGQLGINAITNVCRITPTSVCLDYTFKQIVAGTDITMGIDAATGKVWGWGKNDIGQIGTASVGGTYSTPIAVYGNFTYSQITATTHILGIDAPTGKLWAWGLGSSGQLGTNAVTCKQTPTAVALNLTFSQVSAGSTHSLGIDKTTGKAWAWGSGTSGELGDNQVATHRSTPFAVALDLTWSQLSAGTTFSLGIDYQGKGWAWGLGTSGQLGDNSVVGKSTPIAICLDITWSQLSAGTVFSMGIDYQGKLWAWGDNTQYQLGTFSTTCYSTPVAVCLNKTWASISAAYQFAAGLDSNKIAWAWGDNTYGKLGRDFVGSINQYSVPIAVCEPW